MVKLEAEQIQALCDAFGCAHHELAVYRIREIDEERGQPAHLMLNIGLSKTSICNCKCLSFLRNVTVSW